MSFTKGQAVNMVNMVHSVNDNLHRFASMHKGVREDLCRCNCCCCCRCCFGTATDSVLVRGWAVVAVVGLGLWA